jgi:hypothetical protein
MTTRRPIVMNILKFFFITKKISFNDDGNDDIGCRHAAPHSYDDPLSLCLWFPPVWLLRYSFNITARVIITLPHG